MTYDSSKMGERTFLPDVVPFCGKPATFLTRLAIDLALTLLNSAYAMLVTRFFCVDPLVRGGIWLTTRACVFVRQTKEHLLYIDAQGKSG